MFRLLKSFWRFIFGTKPEQRSVDWDKALSESETVVISKPGAHIHVVQIKLSPEAKKGLTTGVRGIEL